jgi:hypothetical protein
MFGYIEAAVFLANAMCPSLPPRRKTPEEEARDITLETMQAMAVFELQGALLHPTAEGSVECFKQYLQLQTDMLKLMVEPA